MKSLMVPLRPLLISLAFCAEASAQNDVSGYYLLGTESRSAFKEVHWLEVWQTPHPSEPSQVVVTGGVRLYEQLEDGKFVTLPLEEISLQDNWVSFRSAEWRGNYYRFEGSFTRQGVLREIVGEAEVVLVGVLQEVHDEVVVRGQEVSFAYTVGD